MLERQTIINSLSFNLSLLSDQQIHESGRAPYQLSYGFADGVEPADLAGSYTGWRALSAAERNVIRFALSEIETLINVEFTELTDTTDPDISLGKVALSGNIAGYGGVSYQTMGGRLSAYDGFALFDTDTAVTRARDVVMHELGHALGLSHSFGDPALPDAYESNKYTVMSYTENPETGEDAQGMMLFDILALQARWGANLSHATGNDAYTGPKDDLLEVIWDANGTDLLDASARNNGTVLDLREGRFSRFGKMHDDVAIAFDVQIENARGGSGRDRIIGNALGNEMVGGGGQDTVFGNGGRDRIHAGGGDDSAVGGLGRDLIWGGGGRDALHGSAGADGLYGKAGSDFIKGQKGADRLLGGGAADTLQGGAGDDSMRGQRGNDLVIGGAGRDTLHGNSGDDTLRGGAGVDLFVFNATDGNDIIRDFQEGIDRILLSTHFESLTVVRGSAVFNFAGNHSISVVGNFSDPEQTLAALQDDIIFA
ncbi:hypothetical protein AYJ57_25295 (plasmid) [Salipiger sp. CCB-MM3]|uniref:M10 family metallopeptidase n=1 Tax=Salipiger sp. CCB-MM3 TaxID=1792508 RepID=UPI00080A9FA6|nr:M10 family metallopeptidase [Salipiger sp. CCB-MM3]ANT63793.1 hypothetical protein AYJ57_25295 [Salipiger sp. CCB-MM3]